MTVQTTAGILFQNAYESRYTWDDNFPGYSADVQLLQGSDVYTGKIQINRDLDVEVTGVADHQIEEGIYIQLQEIVTHCKRTNFQQSHSQHEFTLGQTDETGSVTILVKGKSIDSQYKIRDRKIYQENRVMGRMALLIETLDYFDTGAGYIANRYDVVFCDSQTNEVSSVLKFTDTYEKFDDYYIMTKQVVEEYENGISDVSLNAADSITNFTYSHIQLL
ncbi:DUF3386 domain-containing protein [Anabaena sp. WFMT]|uniref:DUF3386 domain-containing protein n=1 Tax=Anabaena sp. WFMT TaxID=3449730 RepID=UPI003F1FC7C7